MSLSVNADAKAFFVKFLSEVENAALSFCREHIADAEMPSQKLVVLGT